MAIDTDSGGGIRVYRPSEKGNQNIHKISIERKIIMKQDFPMMNCSVTLLTMKGHLLDKNESRYVVELYENAMSPSISDYKKKENALAFYNSMVTHLQYQLLMYHTDW